MDRLTRLVRLANRSGTSQMVEKLSDVELEMLTQFVSEMDGQPNSDYILSARYWVETNDVVVCVNAQIMMELALMCAEVE